MSESEKVEIINLVNSLQITDIQDFILKNPHKLSSEVLKNVASQFLFQQKLQQKIPTWAANKKLFAPAAISMEQASSETTATWKASAFKAKRLLDLTGGMGIDTYFFSRACNEVVYIEQNKELADVSAFNFKQLEAGNIRVFSEKAEHFLKRTQENFDLIYIDPARRDLQKKKVFLIEDCEPNLLIINELLFKKSSKVLIKYSPLLDIKLACEHLKHVKKVSIIAVKNEVKELLFYLEKTEENLQIETINFGTFQREIFSFSFEEESGIQLNYCSPQQFLYEPNAAILKAGAFKSIALRYDVQKIAANSHLYTNTVLKGDFPGRKFVVKAVLKFDKKMIMSHLKEEKANITCRNFPLKPEEIRKKLKLKEGGNDYLFFTETAQKEKIAILCHKIIPSSNTL